MSLLIFYLVNLSNINNVVSKSPAIIVRESNSLYKSLKTCLMYLGVSMLGAYVFMIIDSCCCIDPFTIRQCPSLSLLTFVALVYFIRDENCNSCFFFALHCLVNLPPSLCFEPLCILACEMGSLETTHWCVLAFYPICQSVSFHWCI